MAVLVVVLDSSRWEGLVDVFLWSIGKSNWGLGRGAGGRGVYLDENDVRAGFGQ